MTKDERDLLIWLARLTQEMAIELYSMRGESPIAKDAIKMVARLKWNVVAGGRPQGLAEGREAPQDAMPPANERGK